MRTLNEVMEIVRDVDAKCGTTLAYVPFKVNNRLQTTAGRCVHTRNTKNVVRIELSKTTMNLDYEAFRQVVLHELAHGVEVQRHGTTDHGARFKEICASIGCYEDEVRSKNVESFVKAKAQISKYVITCKECGSVNHYQRKNRIVNAILAHPTNNPYCKCGACKGRNFEALVR